MFFWFCFNKGITAIVHSCSECAQCSSMLQSFPEKPVLDVAAASFGVLRNELCAAYTVR